MQDILSKLCSCSCCARPGTFCFIILLGVSLAFNAIQLVGMHAFLPDGLVRGHGRRAASRTWPHMSDESFAEKHTVHTEAQQHEAVAAEVAALPEEQPLVPAAASLHRGGAPLAGTQALAAAAVHDGGLVPSRHPTYRLAFTVPWLGRNFPSWFPYFLASCGRSAFLVDWLIFHEDAQLPAEEDMQAAPNVIFHNLGRDGLSRLFGTRIAAALLDEEKGEEGHGGTDGAGAAGGAGGAAALQAARLVSLFRTAFREFSYIVTEYKPTHGIVFAEYLRAYSHWSYTDIDMLIGDLPLHVEHDELSTFDIFTYHFGDVFRLYLRGQFAAHRNSAKVNMLWSECPHLGSGLVKELEAKLQIVRRLASEGKRGRTRFISAEGCYSWVVANAPQMRVKFASKAFADWSDDREFYVVDGAVRKCPQPSLVWTPLGTASAPSTTTANENSAITAAAARAAAAGGGNVASTSCMPFGPRIKPHSLALPGVQRAHGAARLVSIHSECSRWVEERYRLCADLTEEESPFYNVVLSNGSWTAQRFANDEPSGCLEGAFLHLQRWKGEYKRLTYGGRGMTTLKGRRLFKLSRFGVSPFDAEYDDAKGADLEKLKEAPQEKDLTEMDDSEFENQLNALRTAVREEAGTRRKGRQARPR